MRYSGVLISSSVSKWGRLKDEWCRKLRSNVTLFDYCKISGRVHERKCWVGGASSDFRLVSSPYGRTSGITYIWRAAAARYVRSPVKKSNCKTYGPLPWNGLAGCIPATVTSRLRLPWIRHGTDGALFDSVFYSSWDRKNDYRLSGWLIL